MKSLDAQFRDELELPDHLEGVLVHSVDEESPFNKRLRAGMVIIEVNEIPLKYLNWLGSLKIGGKQLLCLV